MNFDGSFLGLMVFLIYLGEMLKSRQGMGTLQGRDRTGNKRSSMEETGKEGQETLVREGAGQNGEGTLRRAKQGDRGHSMKREEQKQAAPSMVWWGPWAGDPGYR